MYISLRRQVPYEINQHQVMKTKLLSTLTVLFLLSAVFAQAVVSTPDPVYDAASEGVCTKTIWYKGQLIPVFDLPEVNISADKQTKRISGAVIRNNEIVILADLPEIEITALRIDGQKFRAIVRHGQTIVEVDLPMIEITAAFPAENLIPLKNSGTPDQNMAVVWLPEVVITPGLSALAMNTILFSPPVKPMVISGSVPNPAASNGKWLEMADNDRKQLLEEIKNYCIKPLPAYIVLIPKNL